MPHLVILYTPQLDHESDLSALCRRLCDALLDVRDEQDTPVFPRGGTRVLAYPAAHHAVSDGGEAGRAAGGDGDYAFMYLNLRMARGRSDATKKQAGDALLAGVKAHFDVIFQTRHLGITLQIDEGQEVFDAKWSNIHPLFVAAKG